MFIRINLFLLTKRAIECQPLEDIYVHKKPLLYGKQTIFRPPRVESKNVIGRINSKTARK